MFFRCDRSRGGSFHKSSKISSSSWASYYAKYQPQITYHSIFFPVNLTDKLQIAFHAVDREWKCQRVKLQPFSSFFVFARLPHSSLWVIDHVLCAGRADSNLHKTAENCEEKALPRELRLFARNKPFAVPKRQSFLIVHPASDHPSHLLINSPRSSTTFSRFENCRDLSSTWDAAAQTIESQHHRRAHKCWGRSPNEMGKVHCDEIEFSAAVEDETRVSVGKLNTYRKTES